MPVSGLFPVDHLSLSPDKHRLYVACSDANAVAVIDVSAVASKVLGFAPTGWYPTAVRSLGDGRLVVLNGKGMGSHPNPDGPNFLRRGSRATKSSMSPPSRRVPPP